MKYFNYILTACCLFLVISCVDLDISPLSEGSTENWNSTEEEVVMSLNDLYKSDFWITASDYWTDDLMYRAQLTEINGGTMTSESTQSNSIWQLSYKAISRANFLIATIGRANLSKEVEAKYIAEAHFMRACMYSRLIFYFGDVVYYENHISLEETDGMGRTDKNIILQKIYDDFDYAILHLPKSYASSELNRATKGAAYAFKARVALHMSDWNTVKNAAWDCMQLGVYKLHNNFGNLFLVTTRNADESIFIVPRSLVYNLSINGNDIVNVISRNAGGYGVEDPTWELFCSFLCTDGLPIDESPLFNPREPFKNRDPRCSYTIVQFGSEHLGFIYDPNPNALKVLNTTTNLMVTNNDTRTNNQYASWNALIWKKGVDKTWLDNGKKTDPDKIYIRYADVLLMYAEAKIELNEIDQSVLDAMNDVRARAYSVNKSNISSYPAITTQNQSELRKILHIERRMEFAREGLRYYDLIRWRLAEKTLNLPVYGLLDPTPMKLLANQGLWFFPETPTVDEDGIADFSGLLNKGYVKKLIDRKFDKERQYLFPIPAKEVMISQGIITQNPNY